MATTLFRHLNREDVILSLALGLVGAIILDGALETLKKFRDATKATAEEKPQGMIGQHTEDAISVDTLGELYNSPNWDIRGASLKILIERSIQAPSLDLLLHNAASKDIPTREQALSTLAFLAAMSTSRMSLRVPKIYGIIVDALVAYLPESANRVHEPHTDWRLRSKTEQYAIIVLRHIMMMPPNGGIKNWLEAGLVSRWLGQYPFCGKRAKELKGPALTRARKKVLSDITSEQTDDRDLEFIFRELSMDRLAWIQLRRHELVDSYWGEVDPWRVPPGYYDVPNPLETSTPSQDGEYYYRRRDNEGQDEAARRRRRREAVVIGDGDQPLSQDNIFNVDSQQEYEGFSRVI